MEKIASFMVDHTKLLPGLYVSRCDKLSDFIFTTFDLRFIRPNTKPVMDTGSIHTIEHLAATFFRNKCSETMYFGPMGCRTGFYLILAGKKDASDIKQMVIECMNYICSYEGAVIGATPEECGNYQDMNLEKAKYYAKKYLTILS